PLVRYDLLADRTMNAHLHVSHSFGIPLTYTPDRISASPNFRSQGKWTPPVTPLSARERREPAPSRELSLARAGSSRAGEKAVSSPAIARAAHVPYRSLTVNRP